MMQKLTYLLMGIGLLLSVPAVAQFNCPVPQAQSDLNINNVSGRILTGGDLFTGLDYTPQFLYNLLPNRPGSIYAAGLWMTGLDDGGNLKLAAQSYRVPGKREYSAGPLDASTGQVYGSSCTDWDKVFSVTKTRIEQFTANIAAYQANPQLGIQEFPDVMGWPGRGNPHFQTVHGFDLPNTSQGLASFYDNNSDGVYNSLAGDYPIVELQGKDPFLPSAIYWVVFNDNGSPHELSGGNNLVMEVQLTAWAFDNSAGAPFSNALFTNHKLIHRAVENLNDFRVGIWVDFDLGCYQDDYIGCAPASNTFYAYNQDAVDGQPGTQCEGGVSTFGNTLPVQTITFLNYPMDKFLAYNNPSFGIAPPATTDPTQPIDYLNFMSGIWKDGTPMTTGGNGYNTGSTDVASYCFPDNPSDVSGWSMCTANLPLGDRRALGVANLGLLQPGAVNELTLAWTLHPDVPGPCNIGNTLEQVGEIQEAFENGFQGVLAAKTPVASFPVTFSPNPANHQVVVQYGDESVKTIRCFDAQGRMVQEINQPAAGAQRIAVNTWAKGVYALQLISERGITTEMLVVE